jgi:uncharacterized membrane protein HdeD (DUF308 family)
MRKTMQVFFTSMWRTILLHGLSGIAFGFLAFTYPQITRDIVLMMIGLFALGGGVVSLWHFFDGAKGSKTVTGLLTAFAGITAGAVCLLFPSFALPYVLLLIGLWNVAAGLLQALGAIALRTEIEHGWIMALAGFLGAGLGLLIMFYPADAAISIIWLIAATAMLMGLLLVLFAFKLRKAAKRSVNA